MSSIEKSISKLEQMRKEVEAEIELEAHKMVDDEFGNFLPEEMKNGIKKHYAEKNKKLYTEQKLQERVNKLIGQ